MSSANGGRSNVKSTKIGLVQAQVRGSRDANLAYAVEQILASGKQGAEIVCLQELFLGPYPCQEETHDYFAEAEPVPGPTTEALSAAAKEADCVVVGSLFEERMQGVYHNTAVVIDRDGTLVGRYRKMHIPDDPGFYEKFYFTPGDGPFGSFPTGAGRVGVCVCWDQWFPEAARLTALSGAQFIFYPTAIGWNHAEKEQWGKSQHEAWETMIRSHAIANGCFVAAVNRTGVEGSIEFWGASVVVNPYGVILERGPHDQEKTLVVECTMDEIVGARTHWPFLRDRRIDAYQDLTRRVVDGPRG